MKVLVIGGGGREHALVWKLAQSCNVDKVYCAPGNGGTGDIAVNVNIEATDFPALAEFAVKEDIGLTVVGPEVPLVEGLADFFAAKGLRVYGPHAAAAQLEGSKIFAKEVMIKAGVPTAAYHAFDNADNALAWLNTQPAGKPWVVKADGNAAGKGVLMCDDRADAIAAVTKVMMAREFGDAGNRVCIEERLNGYEVSLLAICSGTDCLALAPAQDYKRIGEGDTGPNTGGMGNYSPVPEFSAELIQFGIEKVIKPTLQAIPFVGTLFVGLMITAYGPMVLEYNVRFGDPETQVVLPRMKSDLCELFMAAIDGKLAGKTIEWHADKAVTVVLAAGGYPDCYKKGDEISGIADANAIPGVTVFHAGTALKDGKVVTNGGRVLNVTAVAPTFNEAVDKAYAGVAKISWNGKTYRGDIAARVREK